MFVLCPHCQFLVTVDPRSGRPPAVCPSCGKPMEGQAQEDVGEADDAPTPTAPPEQASPAQPAQPEVTPPEPEPAPAPAPEPPQQQDQLNADAIIALMAQKPPRRGRASQAADKAAEKPAKRKREKPAPPPPPVAKPAPPPKPKAPAGPPMSVRLAALWATFKPKAKPAKPAAETPPATQDAKKKATVKAVPSLRERAAKRAADALAAQAPAVETPAVETPAVETPIEPPRVETPPIEFIPLAQTPVEAALAVEALRATAAPETAPTPAPEPAPIAAEPVAPAPEPALPPVVPQPPAFSPPPKPRAALNAPSFTRTRAGLRGQTPTRWTSFAAIGALSLLLAMQLLLAQRDALAANARWRPAISALCGVLRCTLPAWRDPEAFTMLSRDVRPHPSAAGTLQIDASFRNDARWPQAWPRLVVNLSDIDGRVLGSRAFTAREYLGDVSGTQSTLGPGQTAAISLAVVEPAPGVVAFSFEFR
ncbi:DUF3426 domain-containing protein [Lysobacter sp. 2RAF19]